VQQNLRRAIQKAVHDALYEHDLVKSDPTLLTRMIIMWDEWVEEIFADLCGALLAGAAFANSALEIAVERSFSASASGADNFSLDADQLATNDHMHPPDYIRPYVILEVFVWLASILDDKQHSGDLDAFIKSFRERCDKALKGLDANPAKPNGEPVKNAEPVEQTLAHLSLPSVVKAILTCTDWSSNQTQTLGSLFNLEGWLTALNNATDLTKVHVPKTTKATSKASNGPAAANKAVAEFKITQVAETLKQQVLTPGQPNGATQNVDRQVADLLLQLALGISRNIYGSLDGINASDIPRCSNGRYVMDTNNWISVNSPDGNQSLAVMMRKYDPAIDDDHIVRYDPECHTSENS
jgi:hypothetical protein